MNQVNARNYRSEYIDGNTVRQARPQRERRVYVDGRRVQESERELRAREHALAMNGAYVTFLAVVSVVCLMMCVTYLHMQSDISATRSNIAQLKKDISTVQSQNDALTYSINSYVDVDNVYKKATTKLGMKQATGDQISTYKSSDSGYTVQYGDIPTK